MYTFFKTEERYAVERRKLPAFCRVKKGCRGTKKPPRNRKGRRGIKKRPPRNQKKAAAEQKAAAGKFSRGGLYCDIEFLSVPSLTIA